MDIVTKLRGIADASRREDGSDIPLGEQCREAAAKIERLKELLRLALACENDEAGWREDAKLELSK
jgi:hypothetical protein